MQYFLSSFLLGMFIFYGILPNDAHAYLDPGTGSIILQAIAAFLVAAGGVWYAFKAKIRMYFKKSESKSENLESDDLKVNSDKDSSL